MQPLSMLRDSFMYRWYRGSLLIWLKFTHRERHLSRYDERDNLCHVVRTIVFAPVAIAWQIVTWATVVASFVVLPLRWFSGGYPLTILGICALIAGVVGLVCGIETLAERRRRKKLADQGQITGFRKLAKVYAESRLHSKICPWIDFIDQRSRP